MSAYYNEVDAYAAQWLRNLIAAGHIAPGDVDERSIVDVQADNVRGYTQCHFFAGIGGWSVALRLAGWDDDRSVWTGSCPCQPLSVAGSRKGHSDERHLWPAFHRLIAECAPAVVFGEQVTSADGREWFAAVRADLEAAGYAVGAADLCAAGVGAPHIRQRLWFVADGDRERHAPILSEGIRRADCDGQNGRSRLGFERGSTDVSMAYPNGARRPQQPAGTDGRPAQEPGRLRDAGELGNPTSSLRDAPEWSWERDGVPAPQAALPSQSGFWSDCDWLPCTDGKARPVEPGSFPLAHGVQRRASKLRAYGNAIVPQVAAAFIEAARCGL